MSLLQLFFIFFYIGLFAIGGGLVGATFVQHILVEKYALLTQEKFFAMLAVSESTPGPIGINLATYIGTELYGFGGGLVTTIGEVLPSFIVILIIAKFFSKFNERPLVKSVMSFVRPACSGLILVALLNVFTISICKLNMYESFSLLWKELCTTPAKTFSVLFDWKTLLFYAVDLLILFKTKLHPVVIVILGAVFGVLFL